VPAAGAVLAIIEGLQAAWGTVSRVIQAFDRFMGFLKAVKTGQSGPQFGAALAAAGVVLIDFVSNWLLKRVRGAASKVAAKVKEIAKKIGRKLKAASKKLGRKFGKVKDKYFGKKGGKGAKENKHDENKKGNEDQSKEKKKQEKLDQAVTAIKPQAEQLLKRGTSKLYLKTKLLFWKVRYGLSSLTLESDGNINAKVNPSKNILGTKEVTLGKDLMAVFAKAEQEYERKLLSNKDNEQRIKAAKEKWENREPQSLDGLSEYEQAMVIRDTPVPKLYLDNNNDNYHQEAAKKGSKEVVSGVKVWFPSKGQSRGMVQIPGRSHSYDALFTNIQKKAENYGLSQEEIASIIFSSQKRNVSKINFLRTRLRQKVEEFDRLKPMTEKQRAKALNSTEIFIKQLQASVLLTQAYEPSRLPGIPTATIVSSTMAMNGKASLEDVLKSEGKMAPMTFKGAAPEKNGQSSEAQEKTHTRVGNIFKHLAKTVEQKKILVTEGGYDLSQLVAAIENWLLSKSSKNPQELAKSEALLQAELIQLLSSSHRQV
jgi:hypothetical protein